MNHADIAWAVIAYAVIAYLGVVVLLVAFVGRSADLSDRLPEPDPYRIADYDPATTGRADLHDSCPHCQAVTPQLLVDLGLPGHQRSGQQCLICGLTAADTAREVLPQ